MNKKVLAKLDILVTLLQTQKHSIDFNKILEIEPTFDGKWLKMALYKLEEDKYAYELVNEDNKKLRFWSVTIEGSIFNGYVKQFSSLRTNRRLHRIQNWTLSIGTGLAGLYGLFEIQKWSYHHFQWMHFLKFWT